MINRLGLSLIDYRRRGGFSAEYQAVYDSFTTKPSAAVAAAQDAMVIALVAAGVWAKLDIFYLFAQESNGDGEAMKNWVNPGTFDATLVNSPAFVSLEGLTPNGTSSYIRTNYNSVTDHINHNYALFGVSDGAYARTDPNQPNRALFGVSDGANISDIVPSFIRLCSSTNGNKNPVLGMNIITRVGVNKATEINWHENKVAASILSVNFTGEPNEEMYVGVFNNNGSPLLYQICQISNYFAGAGLIQSEIDNYVDALEAYMDSNGKGVVA